MTKRLTRIGRTTLSQMVDAGKMMSGGSLQQTAPPPELWSRNRTRIRIKNNTGQKLERFSVLRAIEMPIPPENCIDSAVREPVFFGEIPTEANRKKGPVAVLLEPADAAGDELVEATIAGTTPALTQGAAGDSPYLDTGDGIVRGVPSESGPMKVIDPGDSNTPTVVLLTGNEPGGFSLIIFKVNDAAYYYEDSADSGDNDCASQPRDAPMKIGAKVIARPCGIASVPEEDANENVTVVDRYEWFFKNRNAVDIEGKYGVAVYVEKPAGVEDDSDSGYGDSGCEWVVIWMDHHRWVQMLGNIEFSQATGLCFDIYNVMVWDDCFVKRVCIPVTSCPTGYYESGSGI